MTNPGSKASGMKKILAAAFLVVLSIIAVLQASSQEAEKYSEMEKENISEGSNEALKEYYGSVLSTIGEESKFNTISTKELKEHIAKAKLFMQQVIGVVKENERRTGKR